MKVSTSETPHCTYTEPLQCYKGQGTMIKNSRQLINGVSNRKAIGPKSPLAGVRVFHIQGRWERQRIYEVTGFSEKVKVPSYVTAHVALPFPEQWPSIHPCRDKHCRAGIFREKTLTFTNRTNSKKVRVLKRDPAPNSTELADTCHANGIHGTGARHISAIPLPASMTLNMNIRNDKVVRQIDD